MLEQKFVRTDTPQEVYTSPWEIHHFPVHLVYPNPYQMRQGEDSEHIRKLADSLLQDGLMQYPIGRFPKELNGRPYMSVELAFGHSRLAAFNLLILEGHSQFKTIPVVVKELSDRQMFELAISENIARKDLTPIEQARAMQTAREVWHMTSAEIGKLFGLSDSATRHKMRLLDLPAPVQEKVAAGDLSEGTARTLLTVQKLAPAVIEPVAEQITTGNLKSVESVNQVIDNVLRNQKDVVTMHGYYNSDKQPRGGKGLWLLGTWAPPDREPKQIASILGEIWKKEDLRDRTLGGLVKDACDGLDDTPVEEIVQELEMPLAFVEQVQVFYQPVACVKCPFYAVVSGTHYCGFELCHKQRKTLYMKEELARISESLGIPVYDPQADGKFVEEYVSWNADIKKKFEKWVEKKADHLRVRIRFDEYNDHAFTDSRIVELVSVNQAYQERKEKEEKQAAEQREANKANAASQADREAIRQLSEGFLNEVVLPVLAQASPLGSVPLEFVKLLTLVVDRWGVARAEIDDTAEDAKDRYLRVIWKPLLRDQIPYTTREAGPIPLATYLQERAPEWGIRLPDQWMALAETFGQS